MAVYQGVDNTFEIVERDDRFIGVSAWPQRYFTGYQKWSEREKQAIRQVRGRVLDIGCGAGRHGLHLQKKGLAVTGIDISPGAIKVCKMRGYQRVKRMSIVEVRKFKAESFDTIIMMGNNFGLFGGYGKAKRLLKELHRITASGGRIIAEATDPYCTKEPLHLSYHRFNRKRGRMAGQLRIRLRHNTIIGQWFDYLLVSRAEMRDILAGTGWQIGQIIADHGPGYTAIVEKIVK